MPDGEWSGSCSNSASCESTGSQELRMLWAIIKLLLFSILILFVNSCGLFWFSSAIQDHNRGIYSGMKSVFRNHLYSENRPPTLEELYAAKEWHWPYSKPAHNLLYKISIPLESYYLYIPDLSAWRDGDIFAVFALTDHGSHGISIVRDFSDGKPGAFREIILGNDAYSELCRTEAKLRRRGIKYIKYRFYIDQDPSMAFVVNESEPLVGK